jgi:hypothetical protein
MIRDNVMDSPWLLSELMKAEWDEKELRTELRRRAGRHMQLKVAVQKIPVDRFANYGGKLQKFGFDFRVDTKEALDKKFGEEPEVAVCAKALSALKETQVFTLEDYKGWYDKVGVRFKRGELDEAMRAVPEKPTLKRERGSQIINKRRLIVLVQAAKRGDPDWRAKADEWLLEVKEAYQESFDLLEAKWIEWRQKRLRTSPRQHGRIEFICNDPRGGKWKLFGLKSTAPYRLEMLWTEIQS